MDRFRSLLWDLGEAIGLPLHVDENEACTILLQEKLSIQLEMDPSYEKLIIVALVSELLPGRFREDVLKEAMKANASYTLPGIFAYIGQIDTLALYSSLKTGQLTGETLADFLESFAREAESWQSAIAKGLPAPTPLK